MKGVVVAAAAGGATHQARQLICLSRRWLLFCRRLKQLLYELCVARLSRIVQRAASNKAELKTWQGSSDDGGLGRRDRAMKTFWQRRRAASGKHTHKLFSPLLSSSLSLPEYSAADIAVAIALAGRPAQLVTLEYDAWKSAATSDCLSAAPPGRLASILRHRSQTGFTCELGTSLQPTPRRLVLTCFRPTRSV